MSDKISAENDAMAAKHGIKNEPAPIHNDGVSAHDLLIEEIRKRKEFGMEKYGTILQSQNGRNHFNDIIQELIDAAAYAMVARDEWDKQRNTDPDFNFDPRSTAYMNSSGELTILGAEIVTKGLDIIVEACGRQQQFNGWRSEDRGILEELFLVGTEVSEAGEEYRNHHEPHEQYTGNKGKPEGMPSELADVLIRVGDMCEKYGIPLSEAFITKFGYNFTRGYRHSSDNNGIPKKA